MRLWGGMSARSLLANLNHEIGECIFLPCLSVLDTQLPPLFCANVSQGPDGHPCYLHTCSQQWTPISSSQQA